MPKKKRRSFKTWNAIQKREEKAVAGQSKPRSFIREEVVTRVAAQYEDLFRKPIPVHDVNGGDHTVEDVVRSILLDGRDAFSDDSLLDWMELYSTWTETIGTNRTTVSIEFAKPEPGWTLRDCLRAAMNLTPTGEHFPPMKEGYRKPTVTELEALMDKHGSDNISLLPSGEVVRMGIREKYASILATTGPWITKPEQE